MNYPFIETIEGCAAAAKALGLPDITPQVPQTFFRPYACFFYETHNASANERLWFNNSTGGDRSSADSIYNSLCCEPPFRPLPEFYCVPSSIGVRSSSIGISRSHAGPRSATQKSKFRKVLTLLPTPSPCVVSLSLWTAACAPTTAAPTAAPAPTATIDPTTAAPTDSPTAPTPTTIHPTTATPTTTRPTTVAPTLPPGTSAPTKPSVPSTTPAVLSPIEFTAVASGSAVAAILLMAWAYRRCGSGLKRAYHRMEMSDVSDNEPSASSSSALGPTDEYDGEGESDQVLLSAPGSSGVLSRDTPTMVDLRRAANAVFTTGQLSPGPDAIRAPPLLEASQLVLGKVIGSGHFGVVHEAALSMQGAATGGAVRVAVKSCKVPETGDEPASEEDLLQEAVLMAQLAHPNVAELVGLCMASAPWQLQLVMRYYEGGSLHTKLVARAFVHDRYKAVVMIGIDVSAGMHYLSSKGFVHRDLAARNVLVDTASQPWTFKISDFGLARRMKGGLPSSHYSQQSSVGAAFLWTAPEAYMTGRYTSASDVFSFSILSWEVLFDGVQPHTGLSMVEVMVNGAVGARLQLPPASQNGSSAAKINALVAACWHADPDQRPSFWAVYSVLRDISGFAPYRETPAPLIPMRTIPAHQDISGFAPYRETPAPLIPMRTIPAHQEAHFGVGTLASSAL